jgi:hypothetical protein
VTNAVPLALLQLHNMGLVGDPDYYKARNAVIYRLPTA